MGSKKKKQRVELRRNLSKPPRENDLTRQFENDATDDVANTERVRAKGDVSRHRTITVTGEAVATGDLPVDVMPGGGAGVAGRVVRVHGLHSYVELAGGETVRCTVRRLLKSLVTDERSVVTTGDRVWVRRDANGTEGTIERVDPRHGVLTRESRGREHVLVANVDQVAIVISLVEPDLKPHLIDRYIAATLRGRLSPIVLLNKADRVDPAQFQPLVGAYSQLGVPIVLTSAVSGRGLGRLRHLLTGRATVFSGQSGVGKSSLLNALDSELSLRVRTVSEVNSKGRHTTTTAELIRLSFGGWVVDTPGVRQLQLWDTRPEEVEGYFREFHPYVALCRFPDCTHTHELACAVKTAVLRKQISERRYHSYLGLFHGLEDVPTDGVIDKPDRKTRR